MEVRVFAVERAVELLGAGTPNKDVIAKARDIETYIVGDAKLPEIAESDISAARSFLSDIAGMIGQGCNGCALPATRSNEPEIGAEQKPENDVESESRR